MPDEIVNVWDVEYAVERFPDDMPKKEREAMVTNGWIPYYVEGQLVGRAYLSKFEAAEKNTEQPIAEIQITPKEIEE